MLVRVFRITEKLNRRPFNEEGGHFSRELTNNFFWGVANGGKCSLMKARERNYWILSTIL
jgi:hypothetical protein